MTVFDTEKFNNPHRGLTQFHVAATGHSLNYLPEYIAHRRGFFKEQGIEVTVSVPEPWDKVLDELADSTAAAALGGIWVPSMYRNTVKNYTTFAQLANRCPLALVKRGCSEGFNLQEVAGKTVLLKSGNGASVGLYFKMLLRENGVDPRSVNFVQDLSGPMLSKLFQGGMGDYFFIDIVSARVMAANSPALSVAMEMATEGGDIPWSVYYCESADISPSVVDLQKRFCVALEKGMNWVVQNKAESFQDDLAELFPAVPIDILIQITDLYRNNSMWTSSSVSRHGFERWQKGIADGCLVKQPFSYDVVIGDRSTESAKV